MMLHLHDSTSTPYTYCILIQRKVSKNVCKHVSGFKNILHNALTQCFLNICGSRTSSTSSPRLHTPQGKSLQIFLKLGLNHHGSNQNICIA